MLPYLVLNMLLVGYHPCFFLCLLGYIDPSEREYRICCGKGDDHKTVFYPECDAKYNPELQSCPATIRRKVVIYYYYEYVLCVSIIVALLLHTVIQVQCTSNSRQCVDKRRRNPEHFHCWEEVKEEHVNFLPPTSSSSCCCC